MNKANFENRFYMSMDIDGEATRGKLKAPFFGVPPIIHTANSHPQLPFLRH